MAGWLKRVDGSGLETFKIHQKVVEEEEEEETKGFLNSTIVIKEEVRYPGEKFESSFNEYLPVFVKETFGVSCFRLLPPMLGNGQSVDLFKLYLNVQKRGGFVKVSENGLWNSLAQECGFDSSFGSALKLVYVKYLDELEKHLQRVVKGEEAQGSERDAKRNSLGELLMKLESDLKGFLSDIMDKNKKGGEFTSVEVKKKEFDYEYGGKFARLDELGGGFGKLNGDVKNGEKTSVSEDGGMGGVVSDNGKGNADSVDRLFEANIGKDRMVVEDGDMVLDLSDGNEGVLSRKRRRECYLGMLNWINNVARDPCDPAIGCLPERSRWKYYAADIAWKQVLFVREAMLAKTNTDSSDQQTILQKKQKMHPLMYDDQTGSEKQRFSQRILSAKDPSKKSSPVTQGDEHFDEAESDSSTDSDADFVGRRRRKKRIPVGPHWQADVPEWTGEACESNSKWLGNRIWPLERAEQNRNLIERERIGKGRQDSCGCRLPGSFECVKFHVSEKRLRLKLELGPAFYRWKLDNMGEDVALSWTKEEEKKFHNIVKSNPSSLGKFFWHEIMKSFGNKGRESLVSYYYNAFLLQRRGHQNRVTPNDINSDDEESESRYDSDILPGSIFCSPKKHLNIG
ncbi:hypothetical protein ACH5RR_000169 [Cinchona calisaya]|uniref:ARID domain-containing protein n=1 Tax=Cinchona calisaya TaxID=153742 RepID=A0ABD3B0B1_9GENT